MRRFTLIALALIVCSSAAFAGTQTWVWDFGTPQAYDNQGWAAAGHANAGVTVNWANWDNNPSPSMYLPDAGYAMFNIKSLAELANGTTSFAFSANVGFNYNGSTSELMKTGLGFRMEGASYGGVSFWYEGNNSTSERMNHGADSTFITMTSANKAGIFRYYPSNTWDNAANREAKLYVYYNTPGKEGEVWVGFEGVNYLPYVGGGNAYAEWKVGDAKIDPLTGTYYAADKLRLGGDASWAQPYFDNVTLTAYDAVPEPGSMLALGTGLVGLFGFIRRRK